MFECKASGKLKKAKANDPSNIHMTGWYDPKQLFNTAQRVIVSGLFSHHSDRRAFYTEWNNPTAYCVNENDTKEIWIDFVADTGDGGNSTYAVAKQLLAEKILVNIDRNLIDDEELMKSLRALPNHNGKYEFGRGNVLILGGDLVYPAASENAYNEKFISLYAAALPKTYTESSNNPHQINNNHHRQVFAFPQNHDWYDSLNSFSQIFCSYKLEFLDMECPQDQSYASIKLSNNWWIFGLDFGLSGDIDELQFEYFKKVIEGNYRCNQDKEVENKGKGTPLGKDSKIILIYPEPVWTYAAMGYPKNKGSYRYEQLEALIEKYIQTDIQIRLAGDHHYYRRYTDSKNSSHLITCGCGGAFLHPTHGPEKINTIAHTRELAELDKPRKFEYKQKNGGDDLNAVLYKTDDNNRNYPNRKKSFEYSFQTIRSPLFLGKNLRFGIVTGLSYLIIVWMVFVTLHTNIKEANLYSFFFQDKKIYELDFTDLLQAADLWTWSVILTPGCLLLMLLIFYCFVKFTVNFNPHAPEASLILGLLHGLTHLTFVFITYWIVCRMAFLWDWDNHAHLINPVKDELLLAPFLWVGFLVFCFGYIFGSLIMGIYLFSTVNLHRFNKLKYIIYLIILLSIFSILLFATLLHYIFGFIIFSLLLFIILKYDIGAFIHKLIEPNIYHMNEAFSSLKIEDYKGFLRLRITDQKLEAFFIGIDKVPVKWETTGDANLKPKWEEAGNKIQPVLYDYWTIKTKF